MSPEPAPDTYHLMLPIGPGSSTSFAAPGNTFGPEPRVRGGDSQGFTYDRVFDALASVHPCGDNGAMEPVLDFFWHVHDFAQDCVDQGGISYVQLIQPPALDDRP